MIAPDNGHLKREDVKLPVDRCADCDIFFLNPPPPAEIGRGYFAEAYSSSGSSNAYYSNEFKNRVGQMRTQLLADYGIQPGRLLDVGCGKGHFVGTARRNGWDAWGVELDEGACELARQELGLETILNGSTDHPGLPDHFDVVTLWDVIEHVPDPVACLQGAAAKLGPSGWLVVRTGNIRSWVFDRNRRRWWAFGSDHRFYFSPRSLSHTAGLAGFVVVDVLNQERVERPDKRRSADISDTSLRDGLRAIRRSPAKIGGIGRYCINLSRRFFGKLRYGQHYQTSIMTLVARKA